MHIIALAWLYFIGMMAVTTSSAIGGLLLFVSAGVLPVLLIAVWRVRRLRAGKAPTSGLEQEVRDRNDRDA